MRPCSQDEVIPGGELTRWGSRLERSCIEWSCTIGPLAELEDIRSRRQRRLHRGVGCRRGELAGDQTVQPSSKLTLPFRPKGEAEYFTEALVDALIKRKENRKAGRADSSYRGRSSKSSDRRRRSPQSSSSSSSTSCEDRVSLREVDHQQSKTLRSSL